MAHKNSASNHAEPHIKTMLSRDGSQHGWNSFVKLCKVGCDHDLLSWSLLLLYDEPVLTKKSHSGKVKGSKFEMKPTPLDDVRARGGFDLSELDSIAKLAAQLQDQLPKIRQIPFVRELVARRVLPLDDLLYPPSLYLRDPLESRLNGLTKLGDYARRCGPQKRPNFNARLKEIFRHINDRTGQWHDSSVAKILTDLKPDLPHSEESLKAWRHRNGCA